MKKIAATALAAVLAFAPSFASAHEHQMFNIGGRMYAFTVGSLNEPLVVDDKSGVDLRIEDLGAHHGGMSHDHGEGAPVTGLESSLKVELIAGESRKVMDLSPVYNTPGSYKAPFYPTVATTLTYRVFGEMNGTPVDLSFSCNPAGHGPAEDDETAVQVSEGVTRVLKSGSFGCPVEKAAMGFPEASASVQELGSASDDANGMATTALAVAVAALLGAGLALRNSKRSASNQ